MSVEGVSSPANALDCDRCKLPKMTCICQYRPTLRSDIEFCLLTHEAEFDKPTNTGRLIADSLCSTRLFKWHRTEPDQNFLNYIAHSDYQHWLVFPSDDPLQAHRITSFEPSISIVKDKTKGKSKGKINSFILLDGTWQQAAKMFRKSPYLNHLPLISMAPTRLSQYSLRRKSQDHHLCTIEIASELLNIAGEHQNSSILNDYFQVFSQHYLAAKSNHAVKNESKEMNRLKRKMTGEQE